MIQEESVLGEKFKIWVWSKELKGRLFKGGLESLGGANLKKG